MSVNGLLLRYTHLGTEKAAHSQQGKPGGYVCIHSPMRPCLCAIQLARMAIPGSYEYRALMHTMYELRRCMYWSLEEWEFVSSEVTMGDVLGEGGFATVKSCEWFGGAAAVKTFRQEHSSSKRGATTLTKEVCQTWAILEIRMAPNLPQNMSTYLHRRELEVWYRLGHPNVLPFLGACLTGSTPMILTPLSENGNARSYRSTRPDANWLKIVGPSFLRHACSPVDQGLSCWR